MGIDEAWDGDRARTVETPRPSHIDRPGAHRCDPPIVHMDPARCEYPVVRVHRHDCGAFDHELVDHRLLLHMSAGCIQSSTIMDKCAPPCWRLHPRDHSSCKERPDDGLDHPRNWSLDRTAALEDGRVRPEGIALTCLALNVENIFRRMLRHREFDVSELSFGGVRSSAAAAGSTTSPRSRYSCPGPSATRRSTSVATGHLPAGGSSRAARRCAGIPDDGRGLGSRDPGRRIRAAAP